MPKITDLKGRSLLLTKTGLYEPKTNRSRFMVRLSELRTALRSPLSSRILIYELRTRLRLTVQFRHPVADPDSFFLTMTGRIGCSSFSLDQWKALRRYALYGKTTKKTSAKAGA